VEHQRRFASQLFATLWQPATARPARRRYLNSKTLPQQQYAPRPTKSLTAAGTNPTIATGP